MSRRLALIEAGRYALAHGQPDGSRLLARVRELELLTGAQADRIRELEAQCATPLAHVNEGRRADSERLREALARVLAHEDRPEAITAKEALQALERHRFTPLPAERTVRLHLAALRENGNTA